MASFPGKVKIIGGSLRGRQISVPSGDALRPTSSRLRETLFNWLQFEIQDAICLDLFAGSGALGIEALSRGASFTHFVENAKAICEHLKKETLNLKLQDKVGIHCDTALHFISSLKPQTIDVVFIDPPFEQFDVLAYPCVEALLQANILSHEALIYLEMPKAITFKTIPNTKLVKEKIVSEVKAVLLSVNGIE